MQAGKDAYVEKPVSHNVTEGRRIVQVARQTRQALSAAGASVTYREIDDLSHTYPRETNVAILNWMNSGSST